MLDFFQSNTYCVGSFTPWSTCLNHITALEVNNLSSLVGYWKQLSFAYFKSLCIIWNSEKYQNCLLASKLGNFKITFKYSPGYCCGSSWKTQWEKRKLRWFYNYRPMGSSYSSTSRYSFSFYLILCYDSCFETWEIIFGPFSDFVCYFSYKNHQECLSFELLVNICFFYMLVLENRVQILPCWYFCVCLLFNVYNTICGTSSTMYCHLHGLLIVR
jgi:hypothetical protein